jgi:hypothetical protein
MKGNRIAKVKITDPNMNVNFTINLVFALPAFVWVASPSCTPPYSPLKLRGDEGRVGELGPSILDFYCPTMKLAVELDGGQRNLNPSTPPLKLRGG